MFENTISRRTVLGGAGAALALAKQGRAVQPNPSTPAVRDQFLLAEDVTYLNNGSLGPSPKRVLDKVLRTWRKIEQQDPRYLGEVIDKIVVAYREVEDDKGLWKFLSTALNDYGGPKLLKAQVEEIEHREGRVKAVTFLTEWLREHPSLHGLRKLVHLKEDDLKSPAFASDLEPLQALLVNLFDADGMYRCRQCGFTGRTLHWQCPGCKGWYMQAPISDEHLLRQTN